MSSYPPPLRKHTESQENKGQTGSWAWTKQCKRGGVLPAAWGSPRQGGRGGQWQHSPNHSPGLQQHLMDCVHHGGCRPRTAPTASLNPGFSAMLQNRAPGLTAE